MEIERGKVRTREEIMACFKDGQTIAVGGQAGAYILICLKKAVLSTLQSALLMPATQVSQSAV